LAVFAEGYIPTFDVRATIRTDASVEIVEHITYDFGTAQQHGIFRKIPFSYQAQITTYTADIEVLSVTDGNQNLIPFNESRGKGELTIKIGDPERYVTGTNEYIISYVVQGPFLYFDEFDEFYWNVVGSWETDIGQPTILVNLPTGATAIAASCYAGSESDTSPCSHEEKLIGAQQGGYFAAQDSIPQKDGFTVSVAFPKGTIAMVEKPWEPQQGDMALVALPFLLPLLVFVFLLQSWTQTGRDPAGRGTIIPEYEPPRGLTPALAGIIHNERIEPREISAEIVRLAVEGYLRIHQYEKQGLIFSSTDYLFERTGEALPEDEIGRAILERLFKDAYTGTAEINGEQKEGVLLSKLQHAFVKDRDAITDVMYAEVFAQGYFIERPDKIRARYTLIGVALIILGVLVAVAGGEGLFITSGLSVALSGLFVGIFGIVMPARTQQGVATEEHLLGFKQYLEVAEKDRLAFHNAPERTPKLFDQYLPYAMAFGVETQWAAQFADMYTSEPEWHTGTHGTFSTQALTTSLNAFAVDFQAASAPKSSGASGGGSVGGGFGGGGGGSW
jgi:uncharacterized membrane protein YgcG